GYVLNDWEPVKDAPVWVFWRNYPTGPGLDAKETSQIAFTDAGGLFYLDRQPTLDGYGAPEILRIISTAAGYSRVNLGNSVSNLPFLVHLDRSSLSATRTV